MVLEASEEYLKRSPAVVKLSAQLAKQHSMKWRSA
jgi:hypothetical protein